MKPARRASPGWLLCLQLAPLCWPLTGHALGSDRNQPIQIEADKAILNEHAGTSSYEGNVYLHQGTLQLHGNRMNLVLDNKRISQVNIDGNPATFSQRPDNADTDQQAEALHIEYLTGTQRLLLQGNAVIRQGGQEEFRSERIELDLRNNTVKAGGAGSGDRVHITLPPTHPGTPTDSTP
jgi:lipopolysaccharide export system protein LptA